MKRVFLVLTGLLTSLSPLCALAETLETPLALSSWSDPWDIESVDFVLEIPPVAVTEIALRLEGTYWDQHYMCGMPYYWNSAPARIELRIGDEVNEEPYNSVLHSFPQSDNWQPFVFVEVLLSGDPADWLFLADGAGQIGLAVNAHFVDYVMGYPCNPIVVPITVSAATLVVTYDPSVPTAGLTWGSLKQLYR